MDLSDPKVLENLKLEVAVFNRVLDEINTMEISIEEEQMRKESLLCVFFERLFGDGADKKIFNDNVNINKFIRIAKQFNKEVNKEYSNLKGIVIKFPLKN